MIVYAVTLCPTTDYIDAGELSTVAYTLGIAHPTGYPLFTVAGWVFSHLPIPLRVVTRMNLMAALLCSAALFLFFRFFVHILNGLAPKSARIQEGLPESKVAPRTILQVFVPAAAGTLFLAYSETFWSQAVAVEVYSMHLLLIGTVLFLFTRAIAPAQGNPAGGAPLRDSVWYVFAFVLGLAFTNHMTTVLLAPGCLYLYFSSCGGGRESWKRILRMVLPFLAAFSLYLYLPLRAGEHPIMNWGNPATLERFFWHFSGKQYRVWIFASVDTAGRQLRYFFESVLPEFQYVPVVLALAGVWKLFREQRKTGIFTLLLFLGCLLYSINYDIHDIDSYFLLAYVTIALWAAAGAAALIGAIRRTQPASRAAAVLLACALFPLAGNYSRVNESGSTLVEDYTRDMFASLEPNAIIVSYQWDYFVSAAYYFQLVENVRPDVVVIDKELLRRTWYLSQLEQRYPSLIERSRRELNAYLAELTKFEHDLPYDSKIIEFRYSELIHSFVRNNLSSHPVYATPEIEPQYTSGFTRVPSGLAFRLVADTLFHGVAPPPYTLRPPANANTYDKNVLNFYAQSYLNSAIYFARYGRKVEALAWADSALRVQPEYGEARYFKEKVLGNGPF